MEKEDIYDLEVLIQILEDIRDDKKHIINPPKAVLTLAKEIQKLISQIRLLDEELTRIKRLI